MGLSYRRIALVLHEDSFYIRTILRGIHRYSLQRNWLLQLIRPEVDFVQMLQEWRPHGVITHVASMELAEALLQIDRPTVDVADILPERTFARVGVNDRSVGRLAAEHLGATGIRSFGFAGYSGWHFSEERGVGFSEALAGAGIGCELLEMENPLEVVLGRSRREQDRRVVGWLRSLEKPVGIFAANDYLAFELVNTCRRIGLGVPKAVSVVGVDNDTLLCELTDPPLSSVAVPTERLGEECGRLLEELMMNREGAVDVMLEPVAVIGRQSSDLRVVGDARVQKALEFIDAHRGENITVDDVLRAVKTSRRTLERAFRERLDTSPLQEIRRVHLEQAKVLLSQTDLRVEDVAVGSGFTDGKHLATVFRKVTGQSPQEYRHQKG